MAELSGAQIVAKSLKTQGVAEVFGIVGLPVGPVAKALIDEDIRFVGTRHEQAAGYAAQAASYLRGRISAALVVSGPGMMNAVTTLGNAAANCWPMLLIGGSSNLRLLGRGDFQAAPQMDAARLFVKWAEQAQDPRQIPFLVSSAVRQAISGRPGPVYLDLPGDVIEATVDEADVKWEARVPDPTRIEVSDAAVAAAIEALRSAANPLVIIGKGAAWARAEGEIREFIERTQLPFLATPMGKGVAPDEHPLNAAAARTFALKNTDLIFLIGARLNWILHFGLPPRFREGLRVIQLEIEAEEIGANVPTEVPLVGDAKAVMAQLNAYLDERPWQFDDASEWGASIRAETERKHDENVPRFASDESPMNYYRPLKEIEEALPRDAIVISEGENTMAIARQVIMSSHPRARLDAGTWGTMGVGPGFALAAQLVHPDRRVVALEGDSAFGFDATDVETAVRHRLPITWIVFNNNGIGRGTATLDPGRPVPPNALSPGSHYERIIESFGGKGYYCASPDALKAALADAFKQEVPTLIHVELDPKAERRQQEFVWWKR